MPQPGDTMPDGTIYLGQCKLLSTIFNVYAAPEDLPELLPPSQTIEHLATLKDWHGYDGAPYQNEQDFIAALGDDKYDGGWIVPTLDMLRGRDDERQTTGNKDNLFAHKADGAFAGTYTLTPAVVNGRICPGSYLSSSEEQGTHGEYAYTVRMCDGQTDVCNKASISVACRLVRIVPADGAPYTTLGKLKQHAPQRDVFGKRR